MITNRNSVPNEPGFLTLTFTVTRVRYGSGVLFGVYNLIRERGGDDIFGVVASMEGKSYPRSSLSGHILGVISRFVSV